MLFHQKCLDTGPNLVKEKSFVEGPTSQKLQTMVKSSVFKLEHSLKMDPNLRKIRNNKIKNNQISQFFSFLFWERKPLDMGEFQTSSYTSHQK